MDQPADEWDRRILCSDGNCIGVIGADGNCKVCGKPHEGELPLPPDTDPAAPDAADAETSADQPMAEKSDVFEAAPSTSPDAEDDLWENRRLCIDGNCIGVIGPDGRCNECGKPYTG